MSSDCHQPMRGARRHLQVVPHHLQKLAMRQLVLALFGFNQPATGLDEALD
jgi:hypothetical protein